MARRKQPLAESQRDRLGLVFQHLHRALVELEALLREGAGRPVVGEAPGPGPMSGPYVYSVMEAAALLQVGRNACYEGIRRGDVPSIRIGRLIKVPRAALDKLLRERRGE